ncbi:hypothetical protein MVES1_000108 [Malassezia vespertilionis]|uniref:uncharacterized protein n=1 Tax=Malassezia vespertilionis TaxID=2020962 RepID=UPI0024B0ABC4|nr:uncharacterized protein MVES1_000108 [Malassezia vespertilionis]WFD04784.1 hypothetical protein MVES1_000108 [Malassezia vespertilionis]
METAFNAEFTKRLGAAHSLKAQGNDEFAKANYAKAISFFLDAIAQLPPRPETNLEEKELGADDTADEHSTATHTPPEVMETILTEAVSLDGHLITSEIVELRVKLFANLAASHLKLEHYEETIKAATEVMHEDPANVKALYRRAVAKERLGGWNHLSSALEDYKRLEKLDKEGRVPKASRAELYAALRRVPPLLENVSEKEKKEMMGNLKTLGNSFLGYFGLSTDNFQMQEQEGGGYSLNFVR